MNTRTKQRRKSAPAATIPPAAVQERRDNNIGRQLLRAFRAFNAVATQKLKARGHENLGIAHTSVLPHIALEGTRLTSIARMASMTKQATAEVLKDLEVQGYIQRISDPADRRAVLIRFTPHGWRFLQDAYEVKAEIEAESASVVGAKSLEGMRKGLATLTNHYEALARADSAS